VLAARSGPGGRSYHAADPGWRRRDVDARPIERDRAIRQELEALRIDRSSEPQRSRRWPWLVVALVVAAAGIGAWLWLAGQAPVVQTVEVRARATGGTGGATVLNASGYVTARRRATVASKITGKLVEVAVEEGMTVEEGQVLARLDDRQFRATLALAESRLEAARRALAEYQARLELAQLTHERTERLVAEGVAGQADLDRDRTEVEALRARLALAREEVEVAVREVELRRTELADTVVRAPFDGVVISKDAQPGEIVSPVSAGGGFTRTGICTLVDMGSLEIEVDVNESYIARVRPGQRVVSTLDAYPDWPIPSSVITTVPAADRQKATVLVRIAFDELDPRILPDMGVKVAFQGEPAAADGSAPVQAVLVPRSAIHDDGGQDVAWVVDGDEVERRAVRIGATSGDEVEVVAGLTAGERVVVETSAALAPGMRVEIE
jgi:RND family efflux transporter MFP subunit